MAKIELDRVSKRFGNVEAVADLSLAVADGEFVVLLGPTGVGKTTTLRLVAGLERPDAGMIRIDDADRTRAEPAQRDVAFVFQQYSLYPHLSVYDNLAFPLRSPLRRMRGARNPHAGDGDRPAPAHRGQARERGDAALRRADAARRHRPRARAATVNLPHGRAALLPRCEAPRRPSSRARAHSAGARRDDPLRHARPDRGHDHGRPDRRNGIGPARAGRDAAADLRGPAHILCCDSARAADREPYPARPSSGTCGRRRALQPSGRGPSTCG